MQAEKYSIKNWAKDDRPREKLLSKTAAALSDSELLAILVHHGTREKSAVDLAKEILLLGKNNLNELGKLSVKEIMSVKGIGEAKAIAIAAPAYPTIGFALLAVLMLATPLILFAIGCAKNSVFLIDGSGALFGMDFVLLLWLRDQRNCAHGDTTA